MDIKWINTLDKSAPPVRDVGRGARGQRVKAVCGFLAFFLGICLVVESSLFFCSNLTSRGGRQWTRDSFAQDYQTTQEFRALISNRLEGLIAMGCGGRVYDSWSYGDANWNDYPAQAALAHQGWSWDKNILYSVSVGQEVKFTNDKTLSTATRAKDLPKGYNFLLQFDGTKATIWKDAKEVDVYGTGYYSEDSLWHLPGYQNFTVSEAASKVSVTLAVLEQPQLFLLGSYDKDGVQQYSQIYQLSQSLVGYRENIMAHAVRLGVGLGLLLVYTLLRTHKKRADQALARGTGRLWFEAKLVTFILLLVCLLPMPDYFSQVWDEMGLSYGSAYHQAIASDISGAEWEMEMKESGWDSPNITWANSGINIGTAISILTNEGGWLLREYVAGLSSYPIPILVILWAFYLLIFNDWRYNKGPWRHGICAMLGAWGLKLPIQKRMSRLAGLLALALAIPLVVAIFLFTIVAHFFSAGPLWWLMLALCIVACVLLACTLKRQQHIWLDLGQVANQVARLRAGQMDQPLELPAHHDLSQMADDLNHVQQGLHQAVEQRTRSEQMKVELVTNVSHDLKTPLTSIISYTELLAQEPLQPPASEYVQILNEKSQRLKAMVQDVFEVSKAASGQLPVKLEQLDFGRLLRQTLADMAQAIEGSGLTLRSTIPEQPVSIVADSDRMYRVFQNLIGNALKYSLPGSRVYLTLSVDAGQAVASVKNTSVTELRSGTDYTGRFVRGDHSRTDGGSGLGLSIADSFTSACGGILSIATEADLFTATVSFPLGQSI